MGKNHEERHQKWLLKQQQELSMNASTAPDITVQATKVEINPEATKAKDAGTNKVSTESDTKTKEEAGEKTGVFDLILSAPKWVYNKAILPAYNFVKGTVIKIKDKAIEFYESERALMKELGMGQYLLDRGGKLGIGLLKVGATVTFAYFLSVYAMSNFGIALFAPQTLLIIGVAALLMIIAKSVLSQRESGAPVSASQIGSHIVEAVMAA